MPGEARKHPHRHPSISKLRIERTPARMTARVRDLRTLVHRQEMMSAGVGREAPPWMLLRRKQTILRVIRQILLLDRASSSRSFCATSTVRACRLLVIDGSSRISARGRRSLSNTSPKRSCATSPTRKPTQKVIDIIARLRAACGCVARKLSRQSNSASVNVLACPKYYHSIDPEITRSVEWHRTSVERAKELVLIQIQVQWRATLQLSRTALPWRGGVLHAPRATALV
jgi:hypothetical protein